MSNEDNRDRNLSVHSSDPEENKNVKIPQNNQQKKKPPPCHPDGTPKFYEDDTPRAQRPKMDFYGFYVHPPTKQEKDEKIQLSDRGYAMCQYDPTHIVLATGLKSHEDGCPDRNIDKVFEKMIRESAYLQEGKKLG